MKILLDENLPHDLRYFLSGHEVSTVAYTASGRNTKLKRIKACKLLERGLLEKSR